MTVKNFSRNQFIALAKKYRAGDELILPYPERSSPGCQLENLSALLHRGKIGVALSPALDPNVVRALEGYGHDLCTTSHQELSACLKFPRSPFDYWRSLQGLNLGISQSVSLLINPTLQLLQQHQETVCGAYIVDGVEQHDTVKKLASWGLTSVTGLTEGFWLGLPQFPTSVVPSDKDFEHIFDDICGAFENQSIDQPSLVHLISLAAIGHPMWTSKHQSRINNAVFAYCQKHQSHGALIRLVLQLIQTIVENNSAPHNFFMPSLELLQNSAILPEYIRTSALATTRAAMD